MSRSWTLRELLAGVADIEADVPVRALAIDSRTVQAGDLFIAYPGVAADGRQFIADAMARGAAAVLYETNGFVPAAGDTPCVGVPDLRRRLGEIAGRFYGSPSRELVVVGVTGTNGKTTCTQLLAQALDDIGSRESAPGSPPSPAGRESESRAPNRCAIIGTLGYGFHGALNTSLHTTPDAVTVHRLLREFRDAGAGYACMEVSSHALDQGRVDAVAFSVAVFTNLTRDHLDYHGDMQAYGAAKAGLFVRPGLKAAVINVDDGFGRGLLNCFGKHVRVVTYGLESGGVTARSLKLTPKGMTLRIVSPAGPAVVTSPLLGRFNAYNLLAVFATLQALGFSPADAARCLSRARPAAGRMERFGGEGRGPLVVVVYAHTPDALEQVLNALRAHVSGKLVCVFGCGGDRDRGKRPLMGRIAESLADQVILTDDNPRTEDPGTIVAEIQAGMNSPAVVIHERRAAIAQAIAAAGPADIVLVAGKGHEDYQQVGTERLSYSDRTTVRELLGEAA
jgi:UDP-N-acetylmuramoyl-L-alanyl-D-glutamate--2,6-diaminopimelate ligase